MSKNTIFVARSLLGSNLQYSQGHCFLSAHFLGKLTLSLLMPLSQCFWEELFMTLECGSTVDHRPCSLLCEAPDLSPTVALPNPHSEFSLKTHLPRVHCNMLPVSLLAGWRTAAFSHTVPVAPSTPSFGEHGIRTCQDLAPILGYTIWSHTELPVKKLSLKFTTAFQDQGVTLSDRLRLVG